MVGQYRSGFSASRKASHGKIAHLCKRGYGRVPLKVKTKGMCGANESRLSTFEKIFRFVVAVVFIDQDVDHPLALFRLPS